MDDIEFVRCSGINEDFIMMLTSRDFTTKETVINSV